MKSFIDAQRKLAYKYNFDNGAISFFPPYAEPKERKNTRGQFVHPLPRLPKPVQEKKKTL